MAKRIKKKVKKTVFVSLMVLVLVFLGLVICVCVNYYLTLNNDIKYVTSSKKYYNLSDFGLVKPVTSDYDNDNIDDNTEIFNGSLKFAKLNPKYKWDYYAEGFPPIEREGVASDIIWFSFREAGYDFKTMISNDIRNQAKKNTYDIEVIDDNIDFRRINNIDVFLSRYAKSLDIDMYNAKEFAPGDIIVFDGGAHVAILSNKYTKDGVPYIIHSIDEKQKQKYENVLEKIDMNITGHYRFVYKDDFEKLMK